MSHHELTYADIQRMQRERAIKRVIEEQRRASRRAAWDMVLSALALFGAVLALMAAFR